MRSEFRYGLLIGAGICLWIVAQHALGIHTGDRAIGEHAGYFSNLVLLVILPLLLRQKQRGNTGGQLTLRQGIASGLVASFIGAAIAYIFTVAYNQWINPDWIDNALALKVANWRAHTVDEAEIRGQITAYRHANSAHGLLVTTVVGLTLVGGFFSAFVTFFFGSRVKSHQVN